jgi:hypothetical protein
VAGFYSANGALYRFTGAELVAPAYKERALSMVLAGGIAGAFIGPNLASATRGLLGVPFAGAYLALVGVALLALLAPDVHDGTHPRDLSEGQRLLLALAVVLAARPPLLLLDEPTRGLDYPTKSRLVRVLSDLADAGHGVVLATHDVELAAEVATRVMVIADGEIVADGPTAAVLVSSPMFAPQVAKVLAPEAWLTVTDVASALDGQAV